MSDTHPTQLTEWLREGWAFIAAIIGWVWHAGRLASKIDNLEKKLDEHLTTSASEFKDNKEIHKYLADAIGDVKEDLAYLRGNHKISKRYEPDE